MTTADRDEGAGVGRSLREIFAVPLVVAAASVVGLLAALVGDGGWDLLSWLGLGLAVLLAARHALPWTRS